MEKTNKSSSQQGAKFCTVATLASVEKSSSDERICPWILKKARRKILQYRLEGKKPASRIGMQDMGLHKAAVGIPCKVHALVGISLVMHILSGLEFLLVLAQLPFRNAHEIARGVVAPGEVNRGNCSPFAVWEFSVLHY